MIPLSTLTELLDRPKNARPESKSIELIDFEARIKVVGSTAKDSRLEIYFHQDRSLDSPVARSEAHERRRHSHTCPLREPRRTRVTRTGGPPEAAPPPPNV